MVKWLGCLPLGLELVGRYLQRHPALFLEEFLAKLKTNKLAAKALFKSQNNDDITTAHEGIAAAFELSWIELTKDTQELACFLSLFAAEPFPWKLVEECFAESDEELSELRDDELLATDLLQITEENTWQLHPLIRKFLQTKLEILPEVDNYKQSFCRAIVEYAKLIPITPTLQEINDCSFLIPHLTETTDNLIDWVKDESLIDCYFGLVKFYNGQGIYNVAANWSNKGLVVIKNHLGEKHPDFATSLNNLAALYDSQGKYKQAEPLYLQALELRKEILGENHPDFATSLNNLAGLYYSQGKYEQAEPLYLQALELRKEILGENHPQVANSFNNLALLYTSQGKYEQAEPLYLQALDLRKELLGENHPDFALSLNNLAGLYDSQGKYEQAETLYLQALKIFVQTLGKEHPKTITIANNLAILQSVSQQQQKKSFWQRLTQMIFRFW
ncbi:MAG: tetratricopeptide repeat protein [Cyanobacteria bacterium P01_F01_bin.143]